MTIEWGECYESAMPTSTVNPLAEYASALGHLASP